LGKDGPHAHSVSGSERGGIDGRTPNGMEATRRLERKDKSKEKFTYQNAAD